jgi:hypothetical protein
VIYGGVDLAVDVKKGVVYLDDLAAVGAVAAASRAVSSIRTSRAQVSGPAAIARGVQTQGTGVVRIGELTYTLVPAHVLGAGGKGRPGDYVTDLATRNAGRPGVELVRRRLPDENRLGAFGRGWDLLAPYRLEAAGPERREFLNALIPERMRLFDPGTGDGEELVFEEQDDRPARYVPADTGHSRIEGLYLMSNGSFRLSEGPGVEWWLDPSGSLSDLVISEGYRIHYEWAGDRLVRLSDDHGGAIDLAYEGARVVRARSRTGEIISYEYSDGRLKSVSRADGDAASTLVPAGPADAPLPGAGE